MNIALKINKIGVNLKQLIKMFLYVFIVFYFGYHLVSGQNGLFNYFKKKVRLEKLQSQLFDIEQKRDQLKVKVHKLYPESLDADLLDEQYRRTTGKIKPNEVIYYYDE